MKTENLSQSSSSTTERKTASSFLVLSTISGVAIILLGAISYYLSTNTTVMP